MSPNRKSRAQGTIEYLVIIAIVVVIALIVVGLLLNMASPSTQVSATGSKINASAQSVAVVQALIGADGNGVLSIKNNTGDGITIDSIIVGNNNQNISPTSFSSSDTKNLQLKNMPGCVAGTAQTYSVKINYTSSNGLPKTQTIENMAVNCEATAIAAQSATAGTTCTESWNCSGFTSTCPQSPNTQTCTDDNNCGTTLNKPSEIQYCTDITIPGITLNNPLPSPFATSSTAISFNFAATDNNAVKLCSIKVNGTDLNSRDNINSGNATIIFSQNFAIGTYDWNVTCTDYNNNSLTSSTSRVIISAPQQRFMYLSTDANFNLGTLSNVTVNNGVKANPVTSATYTSQVIDLTSSATSFNSIKYNSTDLNYGGEINPNTETSLKNGLVGLWHLNETSGTSFADSSGNGLNASCASIPCPTSTTGLWGTNAWNFNGSTNYMQVPNTASLNITTNITLAAWVATTKNNGWPAIIMKGNCSVRPYQLTTDTDGTPMFSSLCSGSWNFMLSSGITIADGKWHHVIGTFNGSTAKIYVDGMLKGTASYSGSLCTLTDPLSIGHQGGCGYPNDSYWSGKIEEVGIWNRALGDTEIFQLYNKGAARLGIAYRSCDDAACSGETWSATRYDANTSISISGVASNKYFQYKGDFTQTHTDLTTGYATLKDVNIGYTN